LLPARTNLLEGLCRFFYCGGSNEITYATPQSWTSQDAPLPQASWNFLIIAVWNTAARFHLNSHNPTWLQNLAQDKSEAHWHLDSIANDPILQYVTRWGRAWSQEFK